MEAISRLAGARRNPNSTRWRSWPRRRRRRNRAKLSGPITGNAENGAALVADRNRGGSCLACHVMGPAAMPICRAMSDPICPKSVIPAATRIIVQLCLRRARFYNADTVMPPWGSHGVFNDQEIGDIVAFPRR